MMWTDDMAGLDDYLTTDPRDEWEEEEEAEEEAIGYDHAIAFVVCEPFAIVVYADGHTGIGY